MVEERHSWIFAAIVMALAMFGVLGHQQGRIEELQKRLQPEFIEDYDYSLGARCPEGVGCPVPMKRNPCYR